MIIDSLSIARSAKRWLQQYCADVHTTSLTLMDLLAGFRAKGLSHKVGPLRASVLNQVACVQHAIPTKERKSRVTLARSPCNGSAKKRRQHS